MTQEKSKKIKYASKVEEQIVEAIKAGKSLSGKDGILTPIIKRALATALEGEMEYYLTSNKTIHEHHSQLTHNLRLKFW